MSDSQIELHLDLQSGMMVGSQRPTHVYAPVDNGLGRHIVAAIGNSFTKSCDDVADAINAALDKDDLEGAARALENGFNALYFAVTEKLFSALERMDAAKLTGEHRRRLLDSRITAAQRLRRHQAAARDADMILREEAAALSAGHKATLNMLIALGALHEGNRETGLARLRKLLRTPEDFDPTHRGWAWRNLSLALDKTDPEARRAARLSADAFLEAGEKDEAGRSLMGLASLLLHEDPAAAVKTLNAMVELLDKEGLHDRRVRGAALRARADRFLTMGLYEDAHRDALAAIEMLQGLIGAEGDMVSSLHLAAITAQQRGDEAAAAQFEAEAAALTEEFHLSHFELAERLIALAKAYDVAEADRLVMDAEAEGNYDVAASVLLCRATAASGLEDEARLALLEDTLRRYRGRARSRILRVIKSAIGMQLDRMKEWERAARWFEEVLTDEPLNRDAVARLVNCYWKGQRWDKAAQVMRRQLDLRGEAPGALYAYAKSLFEAGDIDGALTAAHRSVTLAKGRSPDIESAAVALREQSLNLGGKIIPASEPPPTGPVSLDEFNAALKEFSRFISGAKRMTFWRKDDAGKRAWVQGPEARAQNLLHTYMYARFRERVEIFEELDTGAGRLDVYIKLSGGLSIVLELKMCGGVYSTGYAASGETQLAHYMDNRKTHIGYLVVFDGRIEKQGQPLLSSENGRHTLIETLIDVRPEIR